MKAKIMFDNTMLRRQILENTNLKDLEELRKLIDLREELLLGTLIDSNEDEDVGC